MEFATPPPATQVSTTWRSWWLVPVGICVGTAVAMATGPAEARLSVLIAGIVSTAATSVCVERLLNSERRLRQAIVGHESQRARETYDWQQRLAGVEEKNEAEISALETRLEQQADEWQEKFDSQKGMVDRLGKELLPKELKRLRKGESVEDILYSYDQDEDAPPECKGELRTVLRTALSAVEDEFDRSTAAEQAVISIGTRMQVHTSKIRGQLHHLQGEHYGLPAVAQGLMELDQEIGPADCLAASIVVMGGAERPGRQWQEPQRLLSVVRGGMGRIKDFKRVKLRRLPVLGVDGGLVDHLTLILAHLMDNATRYWPRGHRDPGRRYGLEGGEEASRPAVAGGCGSGARSGRSGGERTGRSARGGKAGPQVWHQGLVRRLALARHVSGCGGAAKVLQSCRRHALPRHPSGASRASVARVR